MYTVLFFSLLPVMKRGVGGPLPALLHGGTGPRGKDLGQGFLPAIL